MNTFPIITEAIQQAFENYYHEDMAPLAERHELDDFGICGYYGRACRQMCNPGGADRAICSHCPLAAFARMRELYPALKVASGAYYNADAPTMTDEEYDQLMRELKQLETNHPEWMQPDSPTQNVAVKREVLMPALENILKAKDFARSVHVVDPPVSEITGKTFVIAWPRSSLSWRDAECCIKSYGGKVSHRLTEKTDYLIAGWTTTSRIARAEALGIKVISHEDLEEMARSLRAPRLDEMPAQKKGEKTMYTYQKEGTVTSECESVVGAGSQADQSEMLLDKAKALIDEYCRTEFACEEGADYSDLSAVPVAYTTTEDEKHEIQAKVDLVGFRIDTFVDGKPVRTETYDSLEKFVENGLSGLNFDDLVYLSEEELAPFYVEEVDPKVREN